MKIGTKLIAIITVINLICIGGLTVSSMMFTRNQVSSMAQENVRVVAGDTGKQIRTWFENIFIEIRGLGQIMSRFDTIKAEDRRYFFNHMLQSIAEENLNVTGVWAIFEPNALDGMDAAFINTEGSDASGRFLSYFYRSEPKGRIFHEAVVDYDNNGPDGDYYHTSLWSGEEAIIEPFYYEVAGTRVLMTSLTVPIVNNGKTIGVVGADIGLTEIGGITGLIKPFGTGKTSVFSHTGIIVAHPDSADRMGKNMLDTETDTMGNQLESLEKAINDGKEFHTETFSVLDNTDMTISVSPFTVGNSKTPWSVVISVPVKTIMAPVARMTSVFIILGIVILGLVTVVILIITRSITSPLKPMAQVFTAIGEGDFTQVLEARSKDEIGDIGRSLNQTMEKIRALIFTIKNKAAALSNTGADLASNMTETAAAINRIASNVKNVGNKVITQSASVTETHATMEQMTINIDKLTRHVEDQINSVTESSSAIEEMLANIGSVTRTIANNAEKVKELSEASAFGKISLNEMVDNIKEIAKESEGLLAINSVIEDIASQTSLLSMNAAIEAAHAGDSGKGFAVVANEIRILAQSSSTQSKTINAVIKKIKESMDKISLSTVNVLNKFETIEGDIKVVSEQIENIRSAMEEQSAGSKQILDAVGQLNENTKQVKGGSMEMLEGSKEVINESKNLEILTQEIAGGMSEMSAGANQINSAVNQVNEISNKNKNDIETLVREVSRFKVE